MRRIVMNGFERAFFPGTDEDHKAFLASMDELFTKAVSSHPFPTTAAVSASAAAPEFPAPSTGGYPSCAP